MREHLVSADIVSSSHSLEELAAALGAAPGEGSHSRGESRAGGRIWRVSVWRLSSNETEATPLVDQVRRLEERSRELELLPPGRLPEGATATLNIGVISDTATLTVSLPPESLLPFLNAGFDLEISFYPAEGGD